MMKSKSPVANDLNQASGVRKYSGGSPKNNAKGQKLRSLLRGPESNSRPNAAEGYLLNPNGTIKSQLRSDDHADVPERQFNKNGTASLADLHGHQARSQVRNRDKSNPNPRPEYQKGNLRDLPMQGSYSNQNTKRRKEESSPNRKREEAAVNNQNSAQEAQLDPDGQYSVVSGVFSFIKTIF